MTFNLSAIMKEAYRRARRWAEPGTYRVEFRRELKWVWRDEKEWAARRAVMAAIEARKSPETRAIEGEILVIEMKDHMNSADFDAVRSLRAKLAEVSVAAA